MSLTSSSGPYQDSVDTFLSLVPGGLQAIPFPMRSFAEIALYGCASEAYDDVLPIAFVNLQ